MSGSAIDDELILVAESALSLGDIDCAGVKNIREITDYQVRHTSGTTIHTIRFGGDSRFSVTYSEDGTVVEYEAYAVQFERLGDEIFVSRSK
jgi:hypothetical protein